MHVAANRISYDFTMDENPYRAPKSPAASRLPSGCLWWLPWLALVLILGTTLLALAIAVTVIAIV